MGNSSTCQELIAEGKKSQLRGDLAHALASFTLATQLNPDDTSAWLLRSEVTADSTEAAYCLEQVLKLEPNNAVANERILVKRVGSLQQEVRQRTEDRNAKRRDRIRGLVPRLTWSAFLLALGLLACAVVGFGVVESGRLASISPKLNGDTIAQVEAPTLAVLELPPTWTPAPTRTLTPMPRLTATPPWKSLYALTVRAGPGTAFPALGTVAQGTILPISGKSADSKYLRVDLGGGAVGWVQTDFVVIGSPDVAQLPVVPTPILAAAPKVVATARPAATQARPSPSPTLGLDYVLGRQPEVIADCAKPWKVSGTVYDSRAGQRVNGVQVRIWASNQLQGTVVSGSYQYNMPGYWEWRFGSNADVSGQIAIVNSDGTRRSDFVNFHLTWNCDGSGAANQVIIDMIGNP